MPRQVASNEYPQHILLWRIKKNINTFKETKKQQHLIKSYDYYVPHQIHPLNFHQNRVHLLCHCQGPLVCCLLPQPKDVPICFLQNRMSFSYNVFSTAPPHMVRANTSVRRGVRPVYVFIPRTDKSRLSTYILFW